MSYTDAPPPKLPQRFELIRQLGQGGMAQVWLARDLEADAQVAIKVLFDHLREDALVIERFRREIVASRKLVDPHIIEIFDLIETPDVTALVMEYHQGRDLKEVIRRVGAIEYDRAIAIVSQILEGLSSAHRAGVIHRDVKPQNILIDDMDRVKLADFGLARVDDLIGITTHTTTLGTIEYMAPEQVGALVIDARADLYAVGVILYELTTGRLPYTASTPIAMARKHRDEPIPRPCAIDPALPESLDLIVRRAMAKSPHDRFNTASEFLDALGEGAAAPTILAAQIPCPACKTPLVVTWAPCLACGHDSGQVLTPGASKIFVPTPPILMAASARSRHAISDTQQGQLDTMLSDPSLGLEPNMHRNRRLRQMRSPPFVIASGLSAESAEVLAKRVEDLGIPVSTSNTAERGQFFNFYRGFLLNRRLIIFIGIWWMGAGCVFCPVSYFLNLMTSVSGSDSSTVAMIVCAAVILLSYAVAFTRGMTPIATLAKRAGADPRRARIPKDASRAHESLMATSSKALYRQLVHAGLALHDRLDATPSAPDASREHLTHLLNAATRRAIHVGKIERFIHKHPPHDLYETIQRTDALIAREEDTHALDALIETKTRTAMLLAEVDAQHHELARQHQSMLDVLVTMRDMDARLGPEKTSHPPELEQLSVILGDLAQALRDDGEEEEERATLAAVVEVEQPTH